MKYKKIIIFFIIVSMLTFTSCWDMVEIDKRAFVYGIYADILGEEEKNSGGEVKASYEGEDGNLFVMLSLANAAKMESKEGKSNYFIEDKGKTIPTIIREINRRLNRMLFFGHTKVVVFGENLLKNDKAFKEFVDFIERNPQLNREIQVAALSGDIKNIKEVKPELDKLPDTYINEIFSQGENNCCILAVDINQMLVSLREYKGRAIIPDINIKENEVESEGLSLINNYKLVSHMDKKFIRTYIIILNRFKRARKYVELEDKSASYLMTSAKSEIKLIDKENLRYKISVVIEGEIEDYTIDEKVSKKETLEKIRKRLEDSFKLEFAELFDFFQRDVGLDYLKIGSYTKKYHYNVYKKYEKNWDEAFKKAQFEFDVNAYIRRVGAAK